MYFSPSTQSDYTLKIVEKSLYICKKLIFIRTRYRQNQHLWRHFRDVMSLENQGVFQLLKEMTFRRILAFY
jgi:hypothetical protein